MSNRMNVNPITTRNLLSLSWHDSQWIPILNASNIMDYFSEQSNPFFDRTCNNETIRMQRLNVDHLQNMTGIEYILLHVQEPILYVIRKQNRLSPSIAKPLVDYYIIAGIVYQAPDLSSVVNSRLLSTIHHLQSAFDEVSSFARYHPNKGYSWDFKNQNSATEKSTKAPESDGKANKDETASSQFQRHRVDMLLVELLKKFSVPQIPTTTSAAPITAVTSTTSATTTTTATIKSETESEKSEIKAEKSVKMSPPSDKNIKQASS